MVKEKTKAKVNVEEFSPAQKTLLVEYYPLVAKIVNSMKGKLPSYADLDELHSVGVAGLADAVRRLDPSRKSSFCGYISLRIKGAIIDELRKLDYMPRSARNEAKKLDKLRDGMELELGRRPEDYELRDRLGMDKRRFDKMMRRTSLCSFVSLNDTADTTDSSSPELAESIPDENSPTAREQLEKKEIGELLRTRILNLNDKQRRIIESYYFEDKKLADIAAEFGVTEARICQIHGQALKILKSKFKN